MTKLDDYQWLFRKAPAMATSIGEDGIYLDVNDAFLKRLGYTREEMVGRRPFDFVTAESGRNIRSGTRKFQVSGSVSLDTRDVAHR